MLHFCLSAKLSKRWIHLGNYTSSWRSLYSCTCADAQNTNDGKTILLRFLILHHKLALLFSGEAKIPLHWGSNNSWLLLFKKTFRHLYVGMVTFSLGHEVPKWPFKHLIPKLIALAMNIHAQIVITSAHSSCTYSLCFTILNC